MAAGAVAFGSLPLARRQRGFRCRILGCSNEPPQTRDIACQGSSKILVLACVRERSRACIESRQVALFSFAISTSWHSISSKGWYSGVPMLSTLYLRFDMHLTWRVTLHMGLVGLMLLAEYFPAPLCTLSVLFLAFDHGIACSPFWELHMTFVLISTSVSVTMSDQYEPVYHCACELAKYSCIIGRVEVRLLLAVVCAEQKDTRDGVGNTILILY